MDRCLGIFPGFGGPGAGLPSGCLSAYQGILYAFIGGERRVGGVSLDGGWARVLLTVWGEVKYDVAHAPTSIMGFIRRSLFRGVP